jgi:PPOX class probable F420-dependent enzyme
MTKLTPLVRTFLEERRFAVLATVNRDGTAQQSVVWYLVEGDEIVMNTKRSRQKDRNLCRDPRVSLCIEDGYRYITLAGTVTLIDDRQIAQKDIERLAIRYNGPEVAARQMNDQFSTEQRVTIRLPIERLHAYGFDR